MKGKTMSSGPNMLKFILGKGQGPANEREKVQKQLFGFSREVNHGFPNKPSCLAWDPILRIIGKLNRMLSFIRHTLKFKLEMCFFLWMNGQLTIEPAHFQMAQKPKVGSGCAFASIGRCH